MYDYIKKNKITGTKSNKGGKDTHSENSKTLMKELMMIQTHGKIYILLGLPWWSSG